MPWSWVVAAVLVSDAVTVLIIVWVSIRKGRSDDRHS